MKPILIGLCGKARSGKDLAGFYLVQNHGFERYAFASPLKRGLETMLSLPHGTCDDERLKDEPISWIGKSPRQMLQTLGTEWGRQCVNQNLWLMLGDRRWRDVQMMPDVTGLVITDVRFANEAQMIRNNGGSVIRIDRPGVREVAAHVSEAGIPDHLVNHTIHNNGTKEDLAAAIKWVAEWRT
jgi:hypothetical protein